ncbi:MAG TPA: hypothetical protein VJ652_15000 [Noviherbaspirillum sp.]|nr:hypothetical protein [Noviherbaspirillum sp.]
MLHDKDCRLSSTLHAHMLPSLQAIRFVVRCLPNGVERLLGVELVPLVEAKAESGMSGRHPLLFPCSVRMTDMMRQAFEALGAVDESGLSCCGFTRAIDEETIEVVGWHCD